ncbi:Oidioi.mRNA.OKI2018_I69.PAR.g12993.t1.cds [Oikopleura dioica]|uniref:Oidioi.mRNA.OKI2018_I69.PAR.g12993.t1.cds n=1 Tax=Oikopleura dioica TaxID=34765 RepID=A0ABN7S2M1_OIKDI|nr:Oidioi.mRNA.OKI2018_I69.PAR.g12993.t1.cds [Oikopleura dioica]
MASESGSKEIEKEVEKGSEEAKDETGRVTIPRVPPAKRPRKRRSERMSSILSDNRKSVLRVTGKKKATETPDAFGHRKESIGEATPFLTKAGRIPGLGQDVLMDRLHLRVAKRDEQWRTKNKGSNISKAILESFINDKQMFPLITDVNRSLPEVPLLRGTKKSES